jgi:hypothetical protein
LHIFEFERSVSALRRFPLILQPQACAKKGTEHRMLANKRCDERCPPLQNLKVKARLEARIREARARVVQEMLDDDATRGEGP